jgi:hypothetical protein
MLQHPGANDQIKAFVCEGQALCQSGNASHPGRPMLEQRESIRVHAGDQRYLVLQQFNQPAAPATEVQDSTFRVNILPDCRFVHVSASTPFGMGGGIALAKAVLAFEIERGATPRCLRILTELLLPPPLPPRWAAARTFSPLPLERVPGPCLPSVLALR